METIQSKHQIVNIIKGVLLAFSFTVISLIIFAALLTYTNLSEATIKPVIITLTGISILLGSSIGSRKIKKNGLINGTIIGVLYILIIYIISGILNSNFSINLTSLAMIIVGLVCGILGRNNRSKCLIFAAIQLKILLICKNSYFKVAIFASLTFYKKIIIKNGKIFQKLLQNFRLCIIIKIVKFLQLNLYLGG